MSKRSSTKNGILNLRGFQHQSLGTRAHMDLSQSGWSVTGDAEFQASTPGLISTRKTGLLLSGRRPFGPKFPTESRSFTPAVESTLSTRFNLLNRGKNETTHTRPRGSPKRSRLALEVRLAASILPRWQIRWDLDMVRTLSPTSYLRPTERRRPLAVG